LVITGKFDGKKGPGRPRTRYLTSLKKWLHPTADENTIIQTSAIRDRRRDVIANARTGHGTAPNDDGLYDTACSLNQLACIGEMSLCHSLDGATLLLPADASNAGST